MKLLLIAIAHWITVFLVSYQSYWMIVVIVWYLCRKLPKRYVCLYGVLALSVIIHDVRTDRAMPDFYEGKVVAVRENYVIVKHGRSKAIVRNVQANLHDWISYTGKYERISGFKNEGTFDYPRYLANQHIFYQLYARSYRIDRLGTSLPSILYRKLDRMEESLFRTMALRFLFQIKSDDEHEFVSLLLNSGMHLSQLMRHIERISSLFVTEMAVSWVTLAFPLLYGAVLGWDLGVLRVFASRLLAMIKLNRYQRLACLIVCLLLIDPHYGLSLSFVFPITLRLALLFRLRSMPSFLYRSLAMFPLLLYANSRFTLFQLVLLPLFRNIFAWVMVFCLFALFVPPMRTPLVSLINWLTSFIEAQSGWMSVGITLRVSLLFMVLWLFWLCYLRIDRKRSLRAMTALLLLVFGFLRYSPWAEVTFLDVGQGDATLIRLPWNQGTILIDTGGHRNMDISDMVLVPYLRSKGITALDLVIVTHDDIDHSGALASLNSQIKIRQIIDKKLSCDEDGIAEVSVGKHKLIFLLQDIAYDNDNDNSLIVLVPLLKETLLFMGDASKAVERTLIRRYQNLEATILHVGHHGADTSTSKELLTQIDPQLAIISSGKNNSYGHPHPDVLARLASLHIPVLDTKTSGNITLCISRFHTFIRTYASRFAIIKAVIT